MDLPQPVRSAFSLVNTPPLDRNVVQMTALIGTAAALSLLAGTGMAYVAGFDAVYERIVNANWVWLLPGVAAVLVGYAGYYVAYRGLYRADDGPQLDAATLAAIVAAGFGGLIAHGAGAFDKRALRASGAGEREARVRVAALAGFEHGALAAVVCPAAIAALILGVSHPRPDFTVLWAIVPVPGFLLAAFLASRYSDRLRGRTGILGRIGIFLDSIQITVDLFRHPARNGWAVLGMGLYWGGDMFALWATTAAFGVKMSALSVIVAIGTGMIVTRRTGPFGGAGLLMVALTPTLWYGVGVPFAAATMGVAAYRFLTLWLPVPAALAALPKLRRLGRDGRQADPTARLALE